MTRPGNSNAGSFDVANVVAVMVTFHPEPEVFLNIQAISAEGIHLIIVDNGSSPEVMMPIRVLNGVEIISLGENIGVASALNCGVARARELGAQWCVTFDQDSRLEPGMIKALVQTIRCSPGTAIVGPRLLNSASRGEHHWLRRNPCWRWGFQWVACEEKGLSDVTMVITSGALTLIDAWEVVGGFDASLFIDFVDTDFCLRVRKAGWRVAVSGGARLRHNLGQRERRYLFGLAFHPTHHSPLRHYYIARNRVPVLRRHAWRELHWAMFECAAAALWFFRVMSFEAQKTLKIRAIILGTWDGLRGRSGPCPPHRWRVLQP